MNKPQRPHPLRMLLIGWLVLLPTLAAGDTRDHAEVERLMTITQQGMALWNVPGMAVAVVTSDKVLMQQGFGHTQAGGGRAVNPHTLFANASTTKAMVVAGILMLADEDKLSLDDRIITHLPELHFADPMLTSQLTVRDLLAHRTGLPSTDFWTFFHNMPLTEQIGLLQHTPPEAGLRSRLIYQNTMFELAGLLIERLSGQRWDHFLTERLWQPIGMMETYGSRGQIPANQVHVMPHYYLNQQVVVGEFDLPADLADAAGSAWTSIHDMSLWAQFLLRGGVTETFDRLISEERFSEMFEPHQLASPGDFYPTTELTQPHWRSYGLGWFQQDFQGRKIDFHTGSLGGLIALIGLDRDNDRAMVVLGNRDHAEMRHALLWEVMDTTADGQRRDWNQQVFDLYARRDAAEEKKWQDLRQQQLKNTRPSLPAEAYAGRYRSVRNGELVVERNGRKLNLNTALVELQLEHWHLDTWLVEFEPWGLRSFATFRIGPDGQVSQLDVYGDTFERLKPENP